MIVASQTRLASAIEAGANVVIGYGIGLIAQLVVFPAVGVHAELRQNLAISAAFTLVSLVRSYALRRWFNARLHAAALRVAERIES